MYPESRSGSGGAFGTQRETLAELRRGSLQLVPESTNDGSVRLLFLENNNLTRAALKSGQIGPYACPDAQVYHTIGNSRYNLVVENHLDFTIYVAVGDGLNVAYKIVPGGSESWNRNANAELPVHISVPGCAESKNAFMFTGYAGKVLHIQRLPVEKEWTGR